MNQTDKTMLVGTAKALRLIDDTCSRRLTDGQPAKADRFKEVSEQVKAGTYEITDAMIHAAADRMLDDVAPLPPETWTLSDAEVRDLNRELARDRRDEDRIDDDAAERDFRELPDPYEPL